MGRATHITLAALTIALFNGGERAVLRALPQVSIAMPDEIIFGAAQPVAKR